MEENDPNNWKVFRYETQDLHEIQKQVNSQKHTEFNTLFIIIM